MPKFLLLSLILVLSGAGLAAGEDEIEMDGDVIRIVGDGTAAQASSEPTVGEHTTNYKIQAMLAKEKRMVKERRREARKEKLRKDREARRAKAKEDKKFHKNKITNYSKDKRYRIT